MARSAMLCVLVATGVGACGGKAAAPPAESAATSTVVPASGAIAPVPAVRTRVDPNADLVVYLDAVGFRTSPLFRALESTLAVLPGAADERAKLTAQCGFDPIQSLNAMALSGVRPGGSIDENSVIVAAQFTEPPERVLDCIARLAPETAAAEIAGRRALASSDGFVIAADGNLVLAGKRARVTSALSQRPSAAPALDEATYLDVRTNAFQAFGMNQVTFSMSRLPEGTRLRFVDEAASPEAAVRAEGRFRQLRDLAKERLSQSLESPEGQRYLGELLDGMAIETKGTAASATLVLAGAQAEAAFTGAIAALAVHGVRRYMAVMKMSEAVVKIAEIAKGLAVSAAGKGNKRFPKSAPRTPKDAPAATKFQPDAKTWSHASWKAIGFKPEEPQYYSYEYETSADGKRATVRAHGDLDGDGVTSRLELGLEITAAGEVVIEPRHRAVEPLE